MSTGAPGMFPILSMIATLIWICYCWTIIFIGYLKVSIRLQCACGRSISDGRRYCSELQEGNCKGNRKKKKTRKKRKDRPTWLSFLTRTALSSSVTTADGSQTGAGNARRQERGSIRGSGNVCAVNWAKTEEEARTMKKSRDHHMDCQLKEKEIEEENGLGLDGHTGGHGRQRVFWQKRGWIQWARRAHFFGSRPSRIIAFVFDRRLAGKLQRSAGFLQNIPGRSSGTWGRTCSIHWEWSKIAQNFLKEERHSKLLKRPISRKLFKIRGVRINE